VLARIYILGLGFLYESKIGRLFQRTMFGLVLNLDYTRWPSKTIIIQ
jgi:hypothetical protein